MRKSSILVLAVSALIAVLAIVAIWTQIVPTYQARAEIRVRPVIPRLVFRTDDNGQIPFYDSFVNTQVSIVRSPSVLQRVLDQQDVRQTQWFRNPPTSLKRRLNGNPDPPPLERLRDALSVRPREQTEIIDVSFTDPNAEDAECIVNAVLNQYIRYIGEASDMDEAKLYRQLTAEYSKLENDIRRQEKTIADLGKRLGTVTPEQLVSSRRIRLDDTGARLSEMRQSIALLEWDKQRTGLDDNNDISVRAAEVTAKPVDPNGPSRMEETTSLVNQLARAKHEEQLLRRELQKQTAEFAGMFEIAQKLESQKKELKHQQDLFDAVRQRLDQKNMERNVRDAIAPVEVLTQAFAPSRPYSDPRIVLTVIALALCLGMGTATVLLMRVLARKGKKDQKI